MFINQQWRTADRDFMTKWGKSSKKLRGDFVLVGKVESFIVCTLDRVFISGSIIELNI